MARGGLVNSANVVVSVIDAASGQSAQYMANPAGGFFQFIPDPFCMPGDTWSGTAFTYKSVAPSGLTQRQVRASFAESGFAAQFNAAVVAASVTSQGSWNPPAVTAVDPVVSSAATTIGLTASQLASLLAQAQNYPA